MSIIPQVLRYLRVTLVTRPVFFLIVVFTGYEDLVIEKMKTRIHLERLLNSEDSATDYEAMVYLHTASLAMPLSREWYNIYTFLFSNYHSKQAKAIGVHREQITELEQREFTRLKKWIYRQIVKR